jgi:DinB superfamily
VELPPLAPADHVCAACAMSYAATTPADAAAIVRQVPARYRAAFAGVADDVVRRRPDATTWSMIEYACHVRDVFVVFIDRITLALTEDRPTFAPLGNDDRAVRLRYDQADVATTLDDLAAAAARFADLIDTLDDDAWPRTASRRPGEERDVLWMARQTAHEGRHHLADVERVRDLVS